MGLFDRKKLPDVASVEQVRMPLFDSQASIPDFLVPAVLRDGSHAGRQVAQDACGGDGAVAGRPNSQVRRLASSPLLTSDAKSAAHSSVDKLRIIALYIMYRDGVPEGDKKRLYQHARLALHEMDAVDNLRQLGLNVDKVRASPALSSCSGADAPDMQDSGRKRKPLFKQKAEEDCYDISRYQPAMRSMLEVRLPQEIPKRC